MRFNVITLFPNLIESVLDANGGVVGQAVSRGDVTIHTVNPRAFTSDLHKTVDDRPFGGGDGMVMLYEPLACALRSLGGDVGHCVYLTPHGKKWSDQKARHWAKTKKVVTLVCGRYAGVDQRFINDFIDEEISIGDFILSGGELGALVLIDSTSRFLANVLGNSQSAEAESFADELLEAPLFTRPRDLTEKKSVPGIFLGGDHAKIQAARRLLSLLITLQKRPDLISDLHKLEIRKSISAVDDFSPEELHACGLDPHFLKELNARLK